MPRDEPDVELPFVDPRQIADSCRETAAQNGLQPAAVEKDLYLTRLIWALAETHSDSLLLKGGTCLSKCDLGYHRLSEDADFVIPWSGHLEHKGTNAFHLNRVRDTLRRIAPVVGINFGNPEGERFRRGSHVLWEVTYPSEFGPGGITVEVSLRPVLRPPRRTALRQLLQGPLFTAYERAYCWALDAAEVRAEKVRAALTREEPALRDFYDLGLFARIGADMASEEFVTLVDAKLAEVKTAPLRQQPPGFGLTAAQRRQLGGSGQRLLAAVVRRTEPVFELDTVLDYYDRLWHPESRL